jgi:hypothetical protein
MKTKNTTYYLAYGMNTNKQQMARRCPAAKAIGTTSLPGYQFVFRGVGDILPTYQKEHFANCVVWEITPECELALDRLEGYPNFYTKLYIDIELNGKVVTAMVYKMRNQSFRLSDPSSHYWEMLHEGYHTYKLPIDQLFFGLPYNSKYKKLWDNEFPEVNNIKAERRLKNKQDAMWNKNIL